MRTTTQENPVLLLDSYKCSHWAQFPDGTTATQLFCESRGGTLPKVQLFGLQYLLHHYLAKRVDHGDVMEATGLFQQHFGTAEFFPAAGWKRVVRHHGGHLPLRIRALPEGMVVPTGTPLFTVESTDPELPWLPGWVEGLLLHAWFPTTVASLDFFSKVELYSRRVRTMDNPMNGIEFALHDFGYRGTSSDESARLGGAAAMVNFAGTDTVPALAMLRDYYHTTCAGFSIPASEHSTMTILGPEGEEGQMHRMVEKFGHLPLFACVSDSYDLFNAINNIWGGSLREDVLNMNATLICRPDSGSPVDIVRDTVLALANKFGTTTNTKGFKVLNKVRVIQGDGIAHDGSMGCILDEIIRHGFSAENVAFGMGGGRLQQMNRDTQKFAIKCCAAIVDGQERAVMKDPITDPGKRSKAGYLDVIPGWRGYQTVAMPYGETHPNSVMRTVFENGEVTYEDTLAEIRARANLYFEREIVNQGLLSRNVLKS